MDEAPASAENQIRSPIGQLYPSEGLTATLLLSRAERRFGFTVVQPVWKTQLMPSDVRQN